MRDNNFLSVIPVLSNLYLKSKSAVGDILRSVYTLLLTVYLEAKSISNMKSTDY